MSIFKVISVLYFALAFMNFIFLVSSDNLEAGITFVQFLLVLFCAGMGTYYLHKES